MKIELQFVKAHMNNVLQDGYESLSQEEKRTLKGRLIDSPRAILLLEFLDVRKGRKFNTVDIVETVYKDEQDEDFTTLRNRYFKLRKHIISLLERSAVNEVSGIALLPLEEELFRCRQLIAANHFDKARKQLSALVNECKRLNIFEILPEALNLLLYSNMAINNLKDHERTLKEVEASSKLLDELRTMQVLARKVYYSVVHRDTKSIAQHLQAMRRIVVRRAAFPRFELYYHFIVVTNAASVPAYSGKGHARHLASLKKLIAKHPGMPAASYEPNGAALMQYYILNADGAHQYMRGDIAESYALFKQAWDIQERIPNLRIRKSESHFRNRIAIEVASSRYREAIQTANELIEFQKQQKQELKRLNAFAELAMVYTYAYPTLKCPNPEFISSQLKAYTAAVRKNDNFGLSAALSTQAVFAFMCKDWDTVKRVMKSETAGAVFHSMNLGVYVELLALTPESPVEKVADVKKKIHHMLNTAVTSDMVYSLRRALSMILFLEGEMRKGK